MRPRIPSMFSIYFVLALASTSARAWTPLYSVDGEHAIQVFEEAGDPPAYKAVGVLPVAFLELLAVLADVKRRPEWVHNLAEARLIGGDTETHTLIYSRYHLPWPAQDRDVVLESWIEPDPAHRTVGIRYKNAKNVIAAPACDECVHVPLTEGEVLLRDAGNAVAVSYAIKMDSGGWLPGWLVQSFVKDAPVKTLRALEAQVKKTHGQYEDFIARHREILP